MYRRTGCGAPFPSFPSRRDAAATIILPGLRAPAPAGAFAPARRVVVRILCLCALVFGVSGAVAQSAQTVPQFTLGTSAVDSVPQTTVVPVQQPPVQVVEHTTVYEESMRSMTRPERRAYRAKLYAQKIDSLVQSRDYMFFPNSMQEVPGGMIRSIYTDYYFFGMFIDHVGVHLPTERGITQYLYVLNFDSPSLSDYRAERLAWGWRISFGFADGDTPYHAGFEVSTATGETVLTLTAPDLVMRYVGWLWDNGSVIPSSGGWTERLLSLMSGSPRTSYPTVSSPGLACILYISATAETETPSSRPSKPRCSVVVALTDTWSSPTPIAPAIAVRMASICGRNLGRCIRIVQSTFPISYPFSRSSAATLRSSIFESMPLKSSDVSGKCIPMSPSAAAPSSASHTACIATSPSECATNPFVCGISIPPSTRGSPSASACTSYPCPILKSVIEFRIFP